MGCPECKARLATCTNCGYLVRIDKLRDIFHKGHCDRCGVALCEPCPERTETTEGKL